MHSATPERPQVTPFWLILLLAVLIGCALWVLFPRKNLEQRLQSSPGNIDLTESYLRNLLHRDPDNTTLQDLLQRIEKTKGLHQAASASPSNEADHAAWKVWEASYTNFQRVSSQNREGSASARLDTLQKQKLIRLQHLGEPQLLYLGQAALALADVALAQRSFDTLLQRLESQAETYHVLEIAAQAALGNGLYEAASQWYQQASAASTSTEQRKKHLLSAVAMLQASNQQEAALVLAEKLLQPYTDDPAVLYQLIAIARAAKQPAVAQRYVKQLLQLSWLRPSADEAHPVAAAGTDVFTPQRQTFFWDHQVPPRLPGILSTAASASSSPQLPFDDEVYALGYAVFMENSNLEDAWRVAKAAVQYAPDDMAWRQRLAEASERTQRPNEALAQWHAIAQRSNDASAWQQVLRIAPGLLEDGPLADALNFQLRQHPQDPKLLAELIATYERLGQPQKGIAVLQSLLPQHPALGEALADLYERVGNDEAALQQWQQLLQQAQYITPNRAMKAAVLALRMGHGDLGLAWLRSGTSTLPDDPHEATEFLRLQAEVADHQNDVPTAEAAYTALLNTDTATPGDYDSFVQLLRQQNQILQAAAVARMGWDKLHRPQHFQQAVMLYAQHQDWDSITLMVEGLRTHTPAEALTELRAQAIFYSLIGDYYQGLRQPAKARAIYKAGLQAFPDNRDLRQALLWLAIDTGDVIALRQLLQAYETEWKQDSSTHDALAAAYLNLSQPQIAIDQYLQPRLAENRQDFLWMMGYADAMEQNQQAELAWRLRKQLLQEQGAALSSSPGSGSARSTQLAQWLQGETGESTRRIARTRLLMNQQPGDTGMAALRELLRMDQQDSSMPPLSNAATDLLLGWYLEAGKYQAVRARLWQQYAHSRSRQQPLWAEITLAIADEDRAAAGRLLETAGEALPRYDHITAAMRVGDTRLAQNVAFETQTNRTFDDPLHQQLTDSLLAFSDSLGIQHASLSLNELAEQSTTATWHLTMTPRWSLNAQALHTLRSSRDRSLLQQPSNERGIDFRLNWKNEDSTLTLRAGQRESQGTYHPLELKWEQRLGSRLRLRGQLGHQLPTEESTSLRMAGMKDQVSLGLSYALTRLDTISLDHVRSRFQLQTGGHAGDGHYTTLQYLHNLRSESPSLQVGMFWTTYRYQEGLVDQLQGRDLDVLRYLPNSPSIISSGFLLPRSFQYYGITLSTDQRYAVDYTRAFRPFASLSLTYHNRDGVGYGANLGLAGSVWGQDHLMLSVNFSKSSPQAAGTTRGLQLSYRRHF